MDTWKIVVEHLLTQDATVEDIAKAVERDVRTVYRALEHLKKDKSFRVLRWGEHGAYVYKVERVEQVSGKAS